MSLNVSYNKSINSGIETASLREVTQKIFERASGKPSDLSNLDLTKFNRASLGTDLYGGRVDAATARQIAMTSTGMQVSLSENALNSLKYLSTEASKSIFNVDGKINVPVTQEIAQRQTNDLPAFGRLTETADLGSDKKGSNPFYRGELLAVNKKEDEKEEKVINIFA